jgi:hypothetical protein
MPKPTSNRAFQPRTSERRKSRYQAEAETDQIDAIALAASEPRSSRVERRCEFFEIVGIP